jgi:hypothetical protein
MNFIGIVVALFEGFKACSPVILAVASGLGMILTKTLGWGISEIFQALALVFSGVSIVGLKNAVAELAVLAPAAQGQASGTGATSAAGTTPGPAAKAK